MNFYLFADPNAIIKLSNYFSSQSCTNTSPACDRTNICLNTLTSRITFAKVQYFSADNSTVITSNGFTI
jgi:hypothetical protein